MEYQMWLWLGDGIVVMIPMATIDTLPVLSMKKRWLLYLKKIKVMRTNKPLKENLRRWKKCGWKMGSHYA